MTASHDDVAAGLSAAQQAYVDGLRELADLFEAHPELAPRIANGEPFYVYTDAEGLHAAARVPGGWKKDSEGDYLRLQRDVGPHRLIVYTAHEQVCERKVIGTRKVTRVIVPDDAPTEEVEEEIVAWVCPDSLLAEVTS